MSAEDLRVEHVRHYRLKRDDMVRLWHDGPAGPVLVAATCRVDGQLHHAEDLAANRNLTGGRQLICLAHHNARQKAHYKTPRGQETAKAARASAPRGGPGGPQGIRGLPAPLPRGAPRAPPRR